MRTFPARLVVRWQRCVLMIKLTASPTSRRRKLSSVTLSLLRRRGPITVPNPDITVFRREGTTPSDRKLNKSGNVIVGLGQAEETDLWLFGSLVLLIHED